MSGQDFNARLATLRALPEVEIYALHPFEHPGGVFRQRGDRLTVTGLEAATFLGQGVADVADPGAFSRGGAA